MSDHESEHSSEHHDEGTHSDGDGHGHGHGGDHGGGGSHGHGHGGPPAAGFERSFALGIAIQTTFVVAEVIVGLSAKSLAVLADAGHNVSDILALALAWGATHLAGRKASKGRTYGMKSASILAAVANALTLVFVNGMVAWEAILRLEAPEPVAAIPIVIVSAIGVAVNGFCAWLFARGSQNDVNVRAAFLHLASDAVVAAGVAITGIAIRYTGWQWLDPVASIVVSILVLVSTWALLRQAIDLAMHAVPRGIDEEKVGKMLASVENVTEVHDLHVWALSTTETALSAHLVMRTMPAGALVGTIEADLRKAFPIHHITLQVEPVGASCSLVEDGTRWVAEQPAAPSS